MELSEQLGVVPRGVPDTIFATLQTSLFRDLEPQLMALASPALSSTSMSKHQRHLSELTDPNPLDATISNALISSSSPASPTWTSFTSTTRMHRVESGKWVAQCSICLDSFARDAVCVTLICSHFFHQLCLRVSRSCFAQVWSTYFFHRNGLGPLLHAHCVGQTTEGTIESLHLRQSPTKLYFC